MPTSTTNYGFTKPDVGGSTNAWGGNLNADLDSIDSVVYGIQTSVPAASTAAPVMDGTAAAGSSAAWARGDHVHPTDVSRAPLASPTFTGTVTIPAGAAISGYATTASLASYAPLASPTFTGTVTIPAGASISGYLPTSGGTLTAGLIVQGPVDLKVQAITAAASTTINRASGENVTLTLGVSITTLTISGWPASGTTGKVRLVITSSGAFAITWPTGTKWAGGTAPTLTTSGTDIVLLMTDTAGTTIYGSVVGQAYA